MSDMDRLVVALESAVEQMSGGYSEEVERLFLTHLQMQASEVREAVSILSERLGGIPESVALTFFVWGMQAAINERKEGT